MSEQTKEEIRKAVIPPKEEMEGGEKMTEEKPKNILLEERDKLKDSKNRLKTEREKKTGATEKEKEEDEAKKLYESGDFISAFPPEMQGLPNKNGVEKKDIQDKRFNVAKYEQEYTKQLDKTLQAEINEVKNTGSLDSLKPDQKKAIQSEMVRKSITIDSISDERKKQITEELNKDIKFRNITDEEKNKKILEAATKPADIQKKIDNFEKAKVAEQAKNSNIPLTPEKIDELAKVNLGLKSFSAQQKEALTLDIIKTGNTTKLGKETGIEIAERVLAEQALSEYTQTIGSENFDVKKLPINIKKNIFLNENFEVPESIKKYMIQIREMIKGGEFIGVDKEGDTAAVGKVLKEYTGLSVDDMPSIASKVGNTQFENLPPFLQAIVEFIARLGAALGDGKLLAQIQGSLDKRSGSSPYGIPGKSAPIEGKGIDNAKGSDIYAAAEKYMGVSEQNDPAKVREMHKSIGQKNWGPDVPWCMSFVQHILRKEMGFNSSQIGSPTASAADGHGIGKHTDSPKKGDIVLIYREGGSGRHIGFVDSVNKDGSVRVLGGNQGSGEVNISTYSKSRVAEFRTLENTTNNLAQGNGGESGHEGNQNTLPESKGSVDKVISYEQSLRLMADPSTPKYDEQGRLIVYKVDANEYKRNAKKQSTYNTNIARGDKDKHFIAVHGTAADDGVSGGLTDEKLDQSGFHTMLDTGLYPYFISKKGIVFSTTENDANHPACVNDKANAITGYDRLNNKGIAIEMSLRADGHGSVEKPNEKQIQSGRDLILALRGKYNIGAGNVITSKDPVRDPVTGEFKGEHSDDFDDSVRAAMGIARYADTARRFREKKFFNDEQATNAKLELALGGNYNIRLKSGEGIDVTADTLNSVLRGTLRGAGQHFIDAGKMYGIQPRFLAAISMHETGNGTSLKSQTGNLMGISNNAGAIDYSDKSAVLSYFSSRGLKHHEEKGTYASIYDQAYKLSNYEPYQGKNTLAEVQSVYAPTPKGGTVQNDSRNLNRFWLGKVEEWMNKIG